MRAHGGVPVAVLTPEMEDAVQRLHAALHPEEVVLFGSRAYGTPRPDSDMDLLVVFAPTAEPLEGRERRARQALGAASRHRVGGHVWTYTREELREQLRRGSTAVRDALVKGTCLFPLGGRSRYAELAGEWSATGATETMLEKARDDLDTAELILASAGGRRNQWWTAASHAQQAAEKALKALIYHLGDEPECTHSLGDLVPRAAELDSVHGRALLLQYQPALADVERYAVQPRYVEAAPVGEAEARRAVATAQAVLAEAVTLTAVR